jgi:hypothetical protein
LLCDKTANITAFAVIRLLFKTTKKPCTNKGCLVAIDGIADLVENTNDIVMSKEASDYVMKWTYEHNVHITTVIHKSGATGKPFGTFRDVYLKKSGGVIDL